MYSNVSIHIVSDYNTNLSPVPQPLPLLYVVLGHHDQGYLASEDEIYFKDAW
jgi:hypothetical protein